jgi:hypothetical protein
MIKSLNYTIMKKLIFFFLLLPLLGLSSAWAQSVKLIGSDFITGAVTFTVDVGAATPTWVLVEYTTDPSPNLATMSRATFTDASCISSSTCTLAAESRGFLLESSATITAKLKDVSGRFSWCGYAFGAPPQAKANPEGGYTLHGTPPFIVNGNMEVSAGTFGAGTCIESITDFTYNPAGRIPAPQVITVSASKTEVDPGTEVTFTATASGGTTTAITYTWDVAGTTATTDANTYSQVLSTPGEATYTVRVTNVNGCEASDAGSICVFSAGTIATATVTTMIGTAPATNPTSEDSPCITYQWRRSGKSSATLTDSNTPAYDISNEYSNYSIPGTYYFTRYAYSPIATQWVASEGTYTLVVTDQLPTSAGTTTWKYGSTLVWSGPIRVPGGCTKVEKGSDQVGYIDDGESYGFFYHTTCVENNQNLICPSPWRLPTAAELRNSVDPAWITSGQWPLDGYFDVSVSEPTNRGTICFLITIPMGSYTWRTGYHIFADGSFSWGNFAGWRYREVRCVKLP